MTTDEQRNEFLQNLRIEAELAQTVSQAGRHLGTTGSELRQLLDADAEARRVWDDGRRRIHQTLTEALVSRVKAGDQAAIRHASQFLRDEPSGGAFDYERVPQQVLVKIVGKSRQAIFAWVRSAGCPQNPDGTFDLGEFLPWLVRHELQKRGGQSIRTAVRQGIRSEFRRLAELLVSGPEGDSDG